MFKKLLLPVILTVLAGIQISASAADLYVPGRLLVSLNEHPRIIDSSEDVIQTDNPAFNDVLADCWISDIQPLIPTVHLSQNRTSEALSRIYIFHFPEDIDVEYNAALIGQLPQVDFVEPDYLLPVTLTPNDPFFASQWHLNRLQCEAGWDAFEDNSGVIIAVIDSGMEWFHPDLTDNIWVNPGEDLDGDGVVYEFDTMPGEVSEYDTIDNDGNNYVDDFVGWDFVINAGGGCHGDEDCYGQDNDPRDFSGHGTHCAGISSAVTDNSVGISSVAWNAKIMCLRAGYEASDGNGYVITSAAANGVYYAVANGAHIITMSFGGGTGNTMRTAGTYAWNSGLLCFHASGNDDTQTYDSSDLADGMVSVAATNSSDHKASFSNYGTWVDVSAPGENIRSTYPVARGSYANLQGTSMACPLAASVAGYIWAVNPGFTNEEVRHQLLYTVDYIDDINPGYEGMLGTGRVNAYKAAYGIFTAVLTMGDINLSDDVDGGNGDLRLMPGESAGVWTELTNSWINPAFNSSVTLATDDPDIDIPEPTYFFGEIDANSSDDNAADPIIFTISPDAEPHYSMLTFSYRSDFSDSASYEIPIMIGEGEVLIYDFDGISGGNDLAEYFQAGAYNAQKNADWYDIDSGDFPEYNGFELTIDDYSAVIFYTGENETTVETAVLESLEAYLIAGGNVVFTGQHLFAAIDDAEFAETYLGCEDAAGETSNRILTGTDGSIWEGEMLLLQGTSGAGNQQVPFPTFSPTSATAVLESGVGSGNWVGFNKAADDWKSVFLAFSFEAAGGGGTTLDLGEAMSIIFYDYFFLPEDVDLPDGNNTLPRELTLNSYPNPFNPSTTLQFSLPLAADVEIVVYDMTGRQIDHLVANAYGAGVHTVNWNAADNASGIYFGVLQTSSGDQIATKMILIK
jgi:subtilisin family serine protease